MENLINASPLDELFFAFSLCLSSSCWIPEGIFVYYGFVDAHINRVPENGEGSMINNLKFNSYADFKCCNAVNKRVPLYDLNYPYSVQKK